MLELVALKAWLIDARACIVLSVINARGYHHSMYVCACNYTYVCPYSTSKKWLMVLRGGLLVTLGVII